MVLSANISAVGDAAAARIIVENPTPQALGEGIVALPTRPRMSVCGPTAGSVPAGAALFPEAEIEFTDEFKRIVWLVSIVPGYSRLLGGLIVHRDLQTALRCHIAALEAVGAVPREILYDRMKTAVIGPP